MNTVARPTLETYVIRIYRRTGRPELEPAGVLERVGGGPPSPFRGFAELCRLLGGGTDKGPREEDPSSARPIG